MSLPIPVQVDYTSRDYASIRSDLISRIRTRIPAWAGEDESDFGVALVEAFAYLGDLMSYYIDRVANEASLTTATRRSSVLALAADLGYQPSGYRPSTLVLKLQNTGTSSLTVPAGTRVSANIEVGDALLSIPFETGSAVTVAANSVESVTATQGETVDGAAGYGESIGVSDGTASQVFTLDYPAVSIESVQVYVYDGVNYYPWTRVDYLADYYPLSRVFRVVENGQGYYDVEFGDGVSGLVPSQSHVVYASYRKVDGVQGNIPSLSSDYWEIVEVPGLTSGQVTVLSGSLSVYNDSAATGGTNPEATELIRSSAPQFFRAANRAVTLEDYRSLSLGVNNCGKANAYAASPASVLVAVSPYRDSGLAEEYPGFSAYVDATSSGTATTELSNLKTAVAVALGPATLAGVAVTVLEPKYVYVVINVSATVVSGVRTADAESLIRQALLSGFDYSVADFGTEVYVADVVAAVSRLGVTKTVTVPTMRRRTDASGSGTIVAAWDEVILLQDTDLTVTWVP